MADLAVLFDASILRQWIVNLGARPAPQRIAHLFCELHARLKSIGQVTDGSFSLPMTQQTLSDIVGISTVHMNRSLMMLRENQMLTFKQSTVHIPNVYKLEDYAAFDPAYLHFELKQNDQPSVGAA